MSKLNIDQQSIKDLFSQKKADFLIPDYQRPYAWTETECQTLWDDICSFAFPNDDYSQFDSDNDEYFLGPIVTYKNSKNKLEIIDGQQRLTTLMLLLRAFYEKFGNMKDKNSVSTRAEIEKCIWKTDEFGNPNKNALKIDSEVATDNDKDEFLQILKTAIVPDEYKSKYAATFRFFKKKIDEFLSSFPSYFAYLPTRILSNCILLPIEAESQDTALRIFSTLNDRGKPLSDADIFKAQFYKYYSDKGEKDDFIKRWKQLEDTCNAIFHPMSGTPMDELFTRYMYYERAKMGIKLSTTESLRKFYEKNGYTILKRDETLGQLEELVAFWNDVANQDAEKFSDRVLRRLFVLNYAPNGMWTYFLSVYFLQNKNADGSLDEDKLFTFLSRITAFIWAYAMTNPGVNALRTPVYAEMIKIVYGEEVKFEDYKFEKASVENTISNYGFFNGRPITKAMLTWWAFQDDAQELLTLETVYEIEHIFAKKRQEVDKTLSSNKYLELLGNKALLEKKINIRASDYRFADKKKYYQGYTTARGQVKPATKVKELITLSNTNADYTEADIKTRNTSILTGFVEYLKVNNLLID